MPHDLRYAPVSLDFPGHLHPRDAFFWVKEKIREHRDLSWVAVIDGLRPITQLFWQSWSVAEKKYFLRRLRPFWEVTRHRIPAASFYALTELNAAGYLSIGKGHVISAQASPSGIDTTYSLDGKIQQEQFQKVINCTGPESNFRKLRLPLIQDLMDQRLVSADELGLGINCTAEGQILDAEGKAVNGLWCIGPMRKAVLWETTAIRELREQAARFPLITA